MFAMRHSLPEPGDLVICQVSWREATPGWTTISRHDNSESEPCHMIMRRWQERDEFPDNPQTAFTWARSRLELLGVYYEC